MIEILNGAELNTFNVYVSLYVNTGVEDYWEKARIVLSNRREQQATDEDMYNHMAVSFKYRPLLGAPAPAIYSDETLAEALLHDVLNVNKK